MSNFENFIFEAIKELEIRDENREMLLKIVRDILRAARKIVLSIHSGNINVVKNVLVQMKEEKNKLDFFKEKFPDLYYSGSVIGCLTEYVEALQFYNYVTSGSIISRTELDVEPTPYLLGLADLIGELRRMAIQSIEANDFSKAENTLGIMEKIYNSLRTAILPEALVPGLRRKVDIARNIVENTRKDLLFYRRSYILSRTLQEVRSTFENSNT